MIYLLADLLHIPAINRWQQQTRTAVRVIRRESLQSGNLREHIDALIQAPAMDGIFSLSDDLCLIAAAVATERGLPSSSPRTIHLAKHKFFSRQALNRAAPHACPVFHLINPREPVPDNLSFPAFAKPALSKASCGAQSVHTIQELEALMNQAIPQLHGMNALYRELAKHNIGILDTESPCAYVVEGLIDGSRQVTLDGYVRGETIEVLGVTESHYLADGISFDYFEYPAPCSQETLEQLTSIAVDYIRETKLIHSLFNIEFVLTNAGPVVVELNTRMSAQFIHLFAQVDDIDLLTLACAIAKGIEPEHPPTSIRNGKRLCHSRVLRRTDDARVTRTPSDSELQALEVDYPNVLITPLVEEGRLLSNYSQDGSTFRYCFVDIPGENEEDISRTLAEIQKRIPFHFDAPNDRGPP